MTVDLEADPRSVRSARQALREVMSRSGADELIDPAVLVVSELVTNALVHAGTAVRLQLWASGQAVRVEVGDGAAHGPVRRQFAESAGTGRGLQLVDELSDRWGTTASTEGKTVWFEMGDTLTGSGGLGEPGASPGAAGATVEVTLRGVPLLMHVAWQQHAATLLREYLLYRLDEDPEILDKHAQASEAMNLLSQQLPVPRMSDDPDALMGEAIEPYVSADEVVLRMSADSVQHFATLDALLGEAVAKARAGHFLSPPTQPEISEMRAWICAEVARQTNGVATSIPWVARTDVRATLADQAELTRVYAVLAEVDEPLLATDEASIVVAASPAALELLGFERAEDILGRRVIAVVPPRFHQAYIAGITLHMTNGGDTLLGVPVDVPMVRADGSEVMVRMEVRSERLDSRRRVFVARFVAI
jgi:PAS domain S-box-containing protein